MKRLVAWALSLLLLAAPASAQMTITGVGGGFGSAAATTTWNPADKEASVGLTNGNLTANNGGGFAYHGVRAIASASSGKKYSEYKIDVFGSSIMSVGVANGSQTLNGGALGESSNGVGTSTSFTSVILNNVSIGSMNGFVSAPDVVCVAVDLTAQKIWYRVNGGNWNNDVIGNQNPATGTGGYSISGLAAGPYFPAITLIAAGDQITANFGATAYSQTPPSGFGNW